MHWNGFRRFLGGIRASLRKEDRGGAEGGAEALFHPYMR